MKNRVASRAYSMYRFDSRAGASAAAIAAARNTGAASAVIATSERGARRILTKKLGADVVKDLYLCHVAPL